MLPTLPTLSLATIPFLNNFLTPTFVQLFWKALFFLMSENLTLHFAWKSASLVNAPSSGTCVRRGKHVLHTAHPILADTKLRRCRAIGLSCLPNVVSHTAHMRAISHDLLPKSLGWRWLHRPGSTLLLRSQRSLAHMLFLALAPQKAGLPTQRIVARRNLDACAHSLYHRLPARSLARGHLCTKVPMRPSRRLPASKTVSAASVATRVLVTGSGHLRNQPFLHVPYLRRWVFLTSACCPGRFIQACFAHFAHASHSARRLLPSEQHADARANDRQPTPWVHLQKHSSQLQNDGTSRTVNSERERSS